MRITEIEIKNFRAFYGSYRIDLQKAGKNLLVYGENGSGKSSLYLALKLVLESAVQDRQFEEHQNIFKDNETGHIKLCLRADQRSKQYAYEWPKTVKKTNDLRIVDASRAKGFLDYKTLLATHYTQREKEAVNVFDLLVNTLLANTIDTTTGKSLSDDWAGVQQATAELKEEIQTAELEEQTAELEEQIQNFNNRLAGELKELRKQASEILGKFGYDVALDFDFPGITYNRDAKTLANQQILLSVKFFDRDIPLHHQFLNEAKLSAIAVSIFLSSFLLQPESELKILALDDVLVGLDMSNRLPVIDIIKEYFSDYQIFFMTYDRVWYEIVKQRTEDSEWKYAEFYFSKTDEYEIPIYKENKAYLEKAKAYLEANDYKACVIYLRTAFEVAIKKFCEKRNLPVKYRENPKYLTSEDFWKPIKKGRGDKPFLERELIDKIELCRKFILNPLSHSLIVPEIKGEIAEAIEVVKKLESELKEKKK